MNNVGERKALNQPTLLDHATSLHPVHPDGPLPNGGRPYPDLEDSTTFPRTDAPYSERRRRLVELVTSVYNTEPSHAEAGQRLADALATERVDQRVAAPLSEAINSFDPRWRRTVGRQLAYGGRERGKVMVGLALLAGVAERDDAGPVRMLGLLARHFGEMAIRILRDIPGAAPDLAWLAERSDLWRHAQAVEALCVLAEPAMFGWLLQHGVRRDTRPVRPDRGTASGSCHRPGGDPRLARSRTGPGEISARCSARRASLEKHPGDRSSVCRSQYLPSGALGRVGANNEPTSTVETRIFVDDRPVVLEAFTAGPAEPPEYLLGLDHRLRADAEPREVRLAEADCTEGCCGALYVTIQRRGDEVVWRDWRNPDNTGLSLSMFTFVAAQYDAEIARAEVDHSWEWHERTVARLVRARLRERPDLLTRWDCHAGWMEARPNDRGRIHISYLSPRRPTSSDEPWLQFVAVLDVPQGEPEAIADDVIRKLSDGDPRRQDRLTGGSREAAEQYGFHWPPSERRK